MTIEEVLKQADEERDLDKLKGLLLEATIAALEQSPEQVPAIVFHLVKHSKSYKSLRDAFTSITEASKEEIEKDIEKYAKYMNAISEKGEEITAEDIRLHRLNSPSEKVH